jgi:nucleoid-associated protein YgaU
MGLFDFMRKGKEEPAKPKQQPARPQQANQQKSDSMVDLNTKQPGTQSQDRPPMQQPSAAAPQAQVYEIKKGDTLSGIAKQQLGDASKWRTIYEANKDVIKNPDLIYPGQKIKIPRK